MPSTVIFTLGFVAGFAFCCLGDIVASQLVKRRKRKQDQADLATGLTIFHGMDEELLSEFKVGDDDAS